MRKGFKQERLRILTKFDSQANFVMHVGMQESKLSRILHGRVRLNDHERRKWAKALDCKPEEIFYNDR